MWEGRSSHLRGRVEVSDRVGWRGPIGHRPSVAERHRRAAAGDRAAPYVLSPRAQRRRERIDRLLVERGLARDAREAQALLMRGKVRVNDVRVTKAGTGVRPDDDIRVAGFTGGFVGRGGLKLEAALTRFDIRVADRVAIDVGASYGGFTDCLLQQGARLVHAVDVGRDQLARRLAADPRVHDLGGRNLSDLAAEDLQPPPDLATVDLSYVSLTAALPELYRVVGGTVESVVLVKPLFEVRRALDVTDPALYEGSGPVLRALAARFPVAAAMVSPIRGGRDAIEYLLHVSPAGRPIGDGDIDRVIAESLAMLAGSGAGC